jgi:hypothetical protein
VSAYFRREERSPQRVRFTRVQDWILPSSTALVEFEDMVVAAGTVRHISPDALQSVEKELGESRAVVPAGHWSAERYQSERDRLEALRAELQSGEATVRNRIKLSRLVEAWDRGDAATRRGLLAVLFDRLHTSGGQVAGYTARSDREAEVMGIMDALRRRVFNVGGDGFEPTASSV